MVDVNHESLRSPKTKTQHGRVPVSLGPLSGGRCVFKKCFSRLKTSKQLMLLMAAATAAYLTGSAKWKSP